MKKFLVFITVGFLIIGCQGEGVEPSPDSFCLFKKNTYTNPNDIGKPAYSFIRCDTDPNYRINDNSRYTGYKTTNCDCSETPK